MTVEPEVRKQVAVSAADKTDPQHAVHGHATS